MGDVVEASTQQPALYLVTDGARLIWIAYEDQVKAQMYVWVATTGRFHRNRGVEADFYWDQDHQYRPIEEAEARQLMREEVGKLDHQKAVKLARYRSDDSTALQVVDVLGSE